MTDRLTGKSALITGGGSGVGAATAAMMARDGAAVTVVDRDPTTAGATVDSIVTAGGRAAAASCDVSNPEDVRVAFDTATAAHHAQRRLQQCGDLGAIEVRPRDTSRRT
jgi:NAD(P)-dependent dehydrogenase (short-subunit alcohol dehydrogenase family)